MATQSKSKTKPAGDPAAFAQAAEERKTGTFYFFGFLGRPRGRSEESSPSWLAVDGCHVESPKGVPRERL